MKIKALCVLMLALCGIVAEAASARLFTGSNSHINQITQDHAGYIWIATDHGLTRFDGHNVKTFIRTVESPSLLNNIVLSVIEDSNNDIWVGTYDGIQKFNRATETFETPRLNYPGVPEFTYVNSIIEDSKGNIWFTTSRSGLICFTAGERKPMWYITTNSAIGSDKTTVVFEDKFGNIWIGTNDSGITVFNPSNNTMTHHAHNPSDDSTLSGNMIYSIAQANDGQLYIASLDGGVDSYNYRTHKFTRKAIPVPGKAFVLKNNPERNIMYIGTDGDGLYAYDFTARQLSPMLPDVRDFDIRHAKVHDVITDRQGNVWASIYQHGALMIPDRNDEAVHYGYNPFNPLKNIGTNPVLSVMKDRDDRLWIGTDGDGIYHTDANGNFRHLHGNDVESNVVMSIFQDSNGRIWAGSYYGGLSRYNEAADAFVPVRIDVDGRRLTEINTISEDDSGCLWLGTNGNGLCVYNPADGSLHRFIHRNEVQPNLQILGNSIHSILFDENGNVWIGTSDAGLSMLDRRTGRFEHYNMVNRRLNNNCVYSIVEDRSGNIWVATSMGLVSISDGKSSFYNETFGIPEESIYGMVLDNDGNLWFSTTDNLLGFSMAEARIAKNISASTVGSREFKRGAAFIDDTGKMYFGGVGGVVSFYPKSFDTYRSLQNLEFQDVSMEGSKGGAFKPVPVSSLDRLEMDYDSNSFRITFGAMEYNNPDDVSYSVKLENYNDAWLPVPKGSQAALFSKIPAGHYNLKVRAQLGESLVERELPVYIRPVFYMTWWAKCFYVIFVLLGILATFIIVRTRNTRRAEHLRLLHEEKSTEEKLQFFTDISHEVRTPLTLILSPIAGLKKNTTDKRILETYEMMESNGERILRMIDQVIDLRKIDSNSLRLQVAPTDIRQFIGRICESFSHSVKTRNISFTTVYSDEVPSTVLIDRDKIDKVVFNVIANALRFTPDGGRVAVAVDIDGSSNLRIRVSDTGPGVPEDSREAIFERFFQAKSRHRSGGTGIGLHLSRKMMDVHHGSIFVESSSPEGSTFAIIIPLAVEIYATDETAADADILPEAPKAVRIEPEAKEAAVRISAAQKSHTILIIEDDIAILDYLSATLSAEYNVLTATDGAKGLEMAVRYRPHCIITDIMMDGMDGLEMCRKIRSNSQICEIPIIILTARAAEAQRLEGIEAGADVYIVKPFNIDILKAQITRLIHSRRIIKQKLTNSELVNETVASMKSGDEKLLERIEAVVVKDLANPDLNVEYIASVIGVSRSHLHRRLKELANVSPSTYIKQARMRHAAILLTEKRMTVSEAAYATGFNSLSHFSTAFKDFYGMSPTNYVLLNTQNDISESIEDNS